MEEEKTKRSVFQSALKFVTDVIKEEKEKEKWEEACIRAVEELPVYRGTRANASWRFCIVKVTLNTAWLAFDRIETGMGFIQREVHPGEYREHWEEVFYYARKLAALESKAKIKGEQPSHLLRRLKLDYERCLFEFLDRYADRYIEFQIAPLKTKRGKQNRMEKFLPGLDDLWSNMTEDAKLRAQELDTLLRAQIENGEI